MQKDDRLVTLPIQEKGAQGSDMPTSASPASPLHTAGREVEQFLDCFRTEPVLEYLDMDRKGLVKYAKRPKSFKATTMQAQIRENR